METGRADSRASIASSMRDRADSRRSSRELTFRSILLCSRVRVWVRSARSLAIEVVEVTWLLPIWRIAASRRPVRRARSAVVEVGKLVLPTSIRSSESKRSSSALIVVEAEGRGGGSRPVPLQREQVPPKRLPVPEQRVHSLAWLI